MDEDELMLEPVTGSLAVPAERAAGAGLGASSFSSMVILIHFLLLPVTSDLKAKILARLLSQKFPQQVESHWEKLLPGIFPLQKIICLYGKESSICTTILGRKRENYTLVLRTAISVPVMLSVSTQTTCAMSRLGAARLRWAGSSLGWGLLGTPQPPRVSGWCPSDATGPRKALAVLLPFRVALG